MRLTLTDKLIARTVADGSAFDVAVKVYDDSTEPWVLDAPTTLRYRIDDPDTLCNILAWTTVTPASSATISITGANNTLTDHNAPRRRYRLTVEADAGLATQTVQTRDYFVTGNLALSA